MAQMNDWLLSYQYVVNSFVNWLQWNEWSAVYGLFLDWLFDHQSYGGGWLIGHHFKDRLITY